MFWATLATSFGCILLFCASKYRCLPTSTNSSYIMQWDLANLGLLMGGVSILLSGGLWVSLFGAWQGLIATIACVILNYIALSFIRPNALYLISASVALIGCCFIYTTISMVIPTTLIS